MYKHEITIRSIQHFLYCKHRWSLMQMENAWNDNIHTVKAGISHRRVHEMGRYKKSNTTVYTSLPVYNDDYNLYGIIDSLEVCGKKYSVVEHKPCRPKNKQNSEKKAFREEDVMQVFAQKLCVDYIFHCDCDAYLYYADTKEKILLPFKKEYNYYLERLKEILEEMNEALDTHKLYPIIKDDRCKGCSLCDICMPTKNTTFDTQKEILKMLKD